MERSTLIEGGCNDAVLLNDWHVIAFSTDVVAGKLVPATPSH
jgi:hypothetical protein